MQRITITLDDELLERLDAHMRLAGTTNRSETLRELARRALLASRNEHDGDCIGVLSFARDNDAPGGGEGSTSLLGARHDQAMAMLAAPLDHRSHLEILVMHGRSAEVRAAAEGVFARRGVRHGSLALVPVRREQATHAHGDAEAQPHVHLVVREGFDT